MYFITGKYLILLCEVKKKQANSKEQVFPTTLASDQVLINAV